MLRDCYSWKKVKYLLYNGAEDWTMSWCQENRCNAVFPKCLGNRIEVVFRTGCFELDLMRLQKHKQTTQVMKTIQTTAVSTMVSTTTIKTSVTEKKTTVNDTSKLRPGVSALIRFMLIIVEMKFTARSIEETPARGNLENISINLHIIMKIFC